MDAPAPYPEGEELVERAPEEEASAASEPSAPDGFITHKVWCIGAVQ